MNNIRGKKHSRENVFSVCYSLITKFTAMVSMKRQSSLLEERSSSCEKVLVRYLSFLQLHSATHVGDHGTRELSAGFYRNKIQFKEMAESFSADAPIVLLSDCSVFLSPFFSTLRYP